MFKKTLPFCVLVLLFSSNLQAKARFTYTDLNITTFIPTSMLPVEAFEEYIPVTIHDVCTTIHNNKNHTIDTVVLNKYNQSWKVQSNVPALTRSATKHIDTIFVFSGSWAGRPGSAQYKYRGNGAYTGYLYLKSNLIPGICVTFDHPTHTRETASFGQIDDQKALKMVLDQVKHTYPNAKIVLVGPCSGSMTVLNFICNEQQIEFYNIKAVILESPSISVEHLGYHVMKKRFFLLGRPIQMLFRNYFSNYDAKAPTILDLAHKIPNHLPILIGALRYDITACYGGIRKIVQAIKRGGNENVCLFTYNGVQKKYPHGHMGKTQEFPLIVNAFLKYHNLAHNPDLGQKGQSYIAFPPKSL